jgi:serine/threonine protein kinase/WD40 repeat protein
VNELDLFTAALAIADPAQRAAYLDSACAGRPEVRRRLDELLAAHDRSHSPLDHGPAAAGLYAATGTYAEATTAPDRPEADSSERPTEMAGTVLAGRYKLVELIGEGGMGAVWMAQQTEPVRRAVAVKLIKAGMDTAQVLARFEAERQALALMDHPNIAKVLDAGATPDGRPFFVMELVKGVPVTAFCDQRRLTPRQRLELFVPVCEAIQHAHQKGIIHRDIKPSNVLIALYDERPVPKVIDFGVAKATGPALTEESVCTAFGAIVGTPEYMSPEQASFNQLDIDTRSDVYALGVLLYELLTGTTPVDRKQLGQAAILEVLRIVREVEAPRPSTKLSSSEALPSIAANRNTEPAKLSRLLKGELDWILLKALEKDRARRYESANSLATDVQRYLAGEVVQAAPPSTAYRLRKFARKHRGPLSAAAVVFLALVGGVIGTALGLTRAVEARGVAEDNEQKAVRVGEQLRDARDEVWANLYASRAAQIQTAWDASDYGHVRELLAAQVPAAGQRDLRGFEWYYLDRQINADLRTVRLLRTRSSPPGPISPDGTRLLRFVEEADGLWLKSFDTSTGQAVLALKMPTGNVREPSFSTDGKWIVAGMLDKPVVGIAIGPMGLRRWDAVTGAEDQGLRGVTLGGRPLSGPDGLPVLCLAPAMPGGPGAVAFPRPPTPLRFGLWDGQTVRTVSTPPLDEPQVQALSPDGKVLAVSEWKSGAVKLLDVRTGKLLQDSAGKIGQAPWGGLVAFSSDGKQIAVVGATLTVWDAATGKQILEVNESVQSPVFSPDGTRIAFVTGPGGAAGRDAKIVDAATGQVRRTLRGHDGGITNLAFSRDGTVLITAGGDRIKHWDATLDERVPAVKDVPRGSGPVIAVSFATPSEDAGRLVRGGTGGFSVWGRGDTPIFTSPRPKLIRQIPVVSLGPPGTPRKPTPPTRNPIPKEAGVIGLGPARLSADGRRVVWWNSLLFDDNGKELWKSELQLWDPDAGRQLVDDERSGRIMAAEFSPDGRRLAAVVEAPGEITVWSTDDGRVMYTRPLPGGQEFKLAFSPDGSRLGVIGKHDDSLVAALWDVESGEPAASTSFPLSGWRPNNAIFPVAFDFGAKRVAVPLQTDVGPGLTTVMVRIWDVATGRAVDLKGFKGLGEFGHLAFSPDGSRLALVRGGKVELWDSESGVELLSVPVDGEVQHLRFSAHGHVVHLVVKTAAGFEARRLDGTPRPGANPP